MVNAYILQFFGIVIAAAPVYVLIRFLSLRRFPKRGIGREIAMGLFFLYVVGLLALALVLGGDYGTPGYMLQNAKERMQTGERINLVPFRTISGFLQHSSASDSFLVNIVGNIIMFMPWGFGLALLWKKNRKVSRMIFWSVLLPLLIETWQLFIGRSVDVDDLILNFVGSILGGLVFLGGRKVTSKTKK